MPTVSPMRASSLRCSSLSGAVRCLQCRCHHRRHPLHRRRHLYLRPRYRSSLSPIISRAGLLVSCPLSRPPSNLNGIQVNTALYRHLHTPITIGAPEGPIITNNIRNSILYLKESTPIFRPHTSQNMYHRGTSNRNNSNINKTKAFLWVLALNHSRSCRIRHSYHRRIHLPRLSECFTAPLSPTSLRLILP